jgi:serine/threonine-protein kinase
MVFPAMKNQVTNAAKTITDMIRGLGRKRGGKASGNLVDALQQGQVPCRDCGKPFLLEGLPPLEMVACPSCQALNPVPMKVSHFWLYEPVGGGGMGSVYKAMDERDPEHMVAMKILARSEKTSPRRIQALFREAAVARALPPHPCLAGFVASGFEDGEYFLAIEFIPSERLDKLLESQGAFPEEQVLKFALQILSAEELIYNQGYLYRDMKPENILITPEKNAVLIDYGLTIPRAQAMNPQDQVVSGSPYYIPPERLWGLGEDAYSEIYSLGLVMYYALTGQTLFDADDAEALVEKHVARVRLSVGKKLQGVRPELNKVLRRMIHQDFNERYASFPDLIADLQPVYEIVQAESAAATATSA